MPPSEPIVSTAPDMSVAEFTPRLLGESALNWRRCVEHAFVGISHQPGNDQAVLGAWPRRRC